jgi:hypothetical protein
MVMTRHQSSSRESQEELKTLERQVSDLQFCVRELVAELTIRRLPERRLKNLRQSWILAYLRGEGMHQLSVADLSEEPLNDGSSHWCCTFHTPSGVPSVPCFYILEDDVDDELLLANRIECVLCMAQYGGSTPSRTLQIIESMANAMERIALESVD